MNGNNEIVNTKENYDYNKMQADLQKLKNKYPFLQLENIGESVQKKKNCSC